ncbi:receptor-like protein kinase ANXUR2 [Bidens hawaiensis]|uniref:receptor-like protein kinase ANXUR2 n=1 Tax=Bidens hawaiensis TaxID=980011 RepID=UPI00404AE404
MHGDVRSSNIFLTDSWVPKVADFGLSKLGLVLDCVPDLTRVPFSHGMLGYLDGYSFSSGGLLMSSDVFSFGVLMFELLCRKPAIDESLDPHERHRTLVRWALDSIKCTGMNLEDVIDSELRTEISPECLKDLSEIAERCLHELSRLRPDIAEVVARLESVLTLQERFSNPLQCAPGVKEFTFNDLRKATRGFSQDSLLRSRSGEAGFWKVYLGCVEHNTLATSEEVAVVAVKSIISETTPVHNEWLVSLTIILHLHPPY